MNRAVFFLNDLDKACYFLGRVILKSDLIVTLEEWESEVNSIKSQRFSYSGG